MKKRNLKEFKKLDKYQFKAVTSKRNVTLVLAGAGCGKTYTITSRVRYLIDYLNVNPKDILCISFTNDAVNKLKDDLNYEIEVLTFHKLALKIIGRKKEVLAEDMLTDIIINTFSNDKLFGLYNMGKQDMYTLIKTFINLFKSNNYKLDKFYTFINKSNAKDKILLKEIMKCYICYESYLNKENLMDFNDMINLAIEGLENSNLRYKHIIVDEYQDTSYTKFLLLKKLIKLSCASFFAVGDDFQSIYRFSGCTLDLFVNFNKYFSDANMLKIQSTYRNSRELISVAGRFIMKNKMQIRKEMNSSISNPKPIKLCYIPIKNLLDTLDGDIMILGRTNNDIYDYIDEDLTKIGDNIFYNKRPELTITYLTIHRSKGLESNNVILLNVVDSLMGIPNTIADDRVLRYVSRSGEYLYDEERRLFYVAITRTRNNVYLMTKKFHESMFIHEIVKSDFNYIEVIK